VLPPGELWHNPKAVARLFWKFHDRCCEVTKSEQEHSESANLRQRQNFNQKWSGIRIRIFELIQIRIRMFVVRSWMHYLVGVSHYAKYGTNRPLIVWEMLTTVQKSRIPQWWKNEVIRNPHAGPDHHKKLTTSRGSPLVHACQVWSTSVSAPVSCLQNDRTITHITSALLVGVTLTNQIKSNLFQATRPIAQTQMTIKHTHTHTYTHTETCKKKVNASTKKLIMT